jgi:CubicO group peptidase (beta-lactamase class C family)
MGVMRLVEADELDLDADVNDRLRSWRVPANGGWRPAVTLRQLLSHTAGLTVHGFPGYAAGVPVPTLPALLDGAGNTPPVRVNLLPGLHFRYSGGATTVVQQLLADVTGEPYPDLMRRLVLDPAGMRDSTYEQPLPARLHDRAASGHHRYGSRVGGRWHVYPEMAAAGLWTTPSDLARFAIEVQRALRGESGLLQRRTAELMLTPHPAPGASFGLGPMLEGEGAAARFGHTGDDEGFVAGVIGYREGGIGAAVMVNSDAGSGILRETLNAVAREYGWPGWLPEPVTPSGEHDPAVAGEYELHDLRAVVEATTSGLSFRLAGQPAMPMIPTRDGYRLAAVNATVTFDEGRLVLTQAGQRLEGHRLVELD